MASTKRKIVIFSGGTAANSLVDVFNEVLERNECTLSYVIPISDNGGSSSELIRVFGGPGIGDVRSMIFSPPPSSTSELCLYVIANPPFPPSAFEKDCLFWILLGWGNCYCYLLKIRALSFFFCALGGDFRLRFSFPIFPIFYIVLFYTIDIIFS